MRRASTLSTAKITKEAERLFAQKVQSKLTLKAKTTTQAIKNGNNTQSNNKEQTKIPVEKLKFAVLDTVFVMGINQVGIVGFIGPTLFSEGIWVGIELLNGSFGKNDGSVLGHRYFECKNSHGIFVRPSYCTKVDSVSINTNPHSHNNTNNHTIPTAPHYISKSPSSPNEHHAENTHHSLDSGSGGGGGGFRAMWVAAESLSASSNQPNYNNLNLPPPRIKSPVHVDSSREQVGFEMNTDSPQRNSPTSRGSLSLSFIPPPRKVTVELTIPPSPSKGSGNGFQTTNVTDATSVDIDVIMEKILESAAFAKKLQLHIDRAVEKSLFPSLDTISHHINQRFISLESLVEAIGSAVAESCDKVDLVITERHHLSEQLDDHFLCNVPAKVAASSSSGKGPCTPTRLPRVPVSSSNDLISSQKQHVDECIVIVDALQIAQNVNGISPKHSPKSNRPDAGSSSSSAAVGVEAGAAAADGDEDGDDVGGEDQTGDVLTSDPYLEIARLRSALTTVSLLAREAQEEIALEREEMVTPTLNLIPNLKLKSFSTLPLLIRFVSMMPAMAVEYFILSMT